MNQRTYHCSFGLCICVVSSMKWDKCSKALFIQIHCEQIQCDYATSNTFDMSGISLTLYILWHISIIQLKVGKSDIIIPCFCFVNWEMCQMWSLVVKQESSFIIYSKCHHRNSHSRAAWCLKHFPTDSVKQQTPPAVLFAADSPLWLRLPGCRHQAAWSGTERWWQQCWRHPSGSRHDSTCVRPLWSATPERRHTHTRHHHAARRDSVFSCVCVCMCSTFSPDTTHRDSVSMHLEFLKHLSSCLFSFTDNSDCLESKETPRMIYTRCTGSLTKWNTFQTQSCSNMSLN